MRVKREVAFRHCCKETADFERTWRQGSGARQGGPDHVVDEVDTLFPLIDSIRSVYGTLVSLPAGIWHFDELASRGKERLSSFFFPLLLLSSPAFLPVYTYIHVYLFAFNNNVCCLFRLSVQLIQSGRTQSIAGLSRWAIAFENLLHRYLRPFPLSVQWYWNVDALSTSRPTQCLSTQRKA